MHRLAPAVLVVLASCGGSRPAPTCHTSIAARARGDYDRPSRDALGPYNRYGARCRTECGGGDAAACAEEAQIEWKEDEEQYRGPDLTHEGHFDHALLFAHACELGDQPSCAWVAANEEAVALATQWRADMEARVAAEGPTETPYDGPKVDFSGHVEPAPVFQCSTDEGARAYDYVSALQGWYVDIASSSLEPPRHLLDGDASHVPIACQPGVSYEMTVVAPGNVNEVEVRVMDDSGLDVGGNDMGRSSGTVDWTCDHDEQVTLTFGFDDYNADDRQCLYTFVLVQPR